LLFLSVCLSVSLSVSGMVSHWWPPKGFFRVSALPCKAGALSWWAMTLWSWRTCLHVTLLSGSTTPLEQPDVRQDGLLCATAGWAWHLQLTCVVC
jgi:hypothetical protein